MNQNLVKLFDILEYTSKISNVGPVHQNLYSELVFGTSPITINYSGYFGDQFVKSRLTNKQTNNTYQWDINFTNHSNNIIECFKDTHIQLHNECIIPIYNDIYNAVSTANGHQLRQSELSRRINCPKNLTNDNRQQHRMIAELVNRLVDKDILTSYKPTRNVRLLSPKNPVPYEILTESDFKFSHKSKLEASINTHLKNIIQDYDNFELIWGIKLNEWKRAPYDFGICLKDDINNIVALIEVDGAQHYQRNIHFHGNDESFNRRIDIDNRKTELAKHLNIPLLRIREDEIRTKNKTIINKLNRFIQQIETI
jgi:hypothetical protein